MGSSVSSLIFTTITGSAYIREVDHAMGTALRRQQVVLCIHTRSHTSQGGHSKMCWKYRSIRFIRISRERVQKRCANESAITIEIDRMYNHFAIEMVADANHESSTLKTTKTTTTDSCPAMPVRRAHARTAQSGITVPPPSAPVEHLGDRRHRA